MQIFMLRLLICSANMSAIIIFFIGIMPLLAKRYSAASCYYAGFVIVAGLIIPFRPHLSHAVVNVEMLSHTIRPVVRIGAGMPITASVNSARIQLLPRSSLWQVMAIVWLVGMLIFLAYHLVKHYQFLKLTARWSKDIINEQALTLMQDIKGEMGLTQNMGLKFCDSIGSPMMIGFIHPCILLPKVHFENDELYFILKHEFVHYKRKDFWYKVLLLIANAIHWFNPMVYLMTGAIHILCELSCDEAVVCNTGVDTRLRYSETLIGVVRHKSKLKTVLSTNFYGGKKGMKKRIFSIMDMSQKKTGHFVLCSMLILTLGTGIVFAAKADPLDLPESVQKDIKEDIAVPTDIYSMLKFIPNPEIYSQYASYGIAISEDGKMLLYNGQRVRLFEDEHSEDEAFFYDEAGTVDLSVIRNTAGHINDIESISEDKAKKIRSAFFADVAEDMKEAYYVEDTTGGNKYEQYLAYGVECSSDGKVLRYKGQRIKILVDMPSEDYFETFWEDEAGTIDLSVVRNSNGEVTGIKSISEEEVQEYKAYEKKILDGLDERVAERLKELYPENE